MITLLPNSTKILKLVGLFFLMAFSVTTMQAQLSDLHYLPPLRQSRWNVDENQPIKEQRLYFSTPETDAFTVNLYRGNDITPLHSISVSSSSPAFYNLPNGNNNITIIQKERAGLVLNNAGLRIESVNGKKFFVNYRANSMNQGTSLTSKGRSALGTTFKWGGLPLNRSQPSNSVTNGNYNINGTLGIMATEDNTVVDLFGYHPSINFRLAANASGLTDNTYQINLNAGESFVFEVVKEGADLAGQFIDGFIGASIVSSKPIAVSYGSMNMSIVDNPNASGWDVGIDQTVPETKIGKDYVLIRGNGNNNEEQVIIIGTENNTNICVNGSSTPIATVNDGDYHIINGTNYTGSSIGASMFIQANKPIYVNQILCGKLNNGKATGELTFISPVNCLMVNEIDNIPFIRTLAANGPSAAFGGITIIASTAVSDTDIVVTSTGDGSSNAYIFTNVPGTDDWKTCFIANLSGHVKVSSNGNGPIAMSYILTGGNVGAAGYFSGFDNLPNVTVQTIGDGCLPSSTLTATSGYSDYSWYNDGVLIPGQTTETYTPTVPGNYSVQVRLATCIYESSPVTLVDCNPEIQISTLANVSSGQPGDTITFTVKAKYIGEGTLTNLVVNNIIPTGLTYQGYSATFGTLSGTATNKNWTIGTMYSGEEHILTVTTQVGAVASSSQVTYSVSHTQTDGNTLADDLTETILLYTAGLFLPSLSDFGDINKFYLDGNFTLLPPTSNSEGNFTYTSSNTSVATVNSAGEVTILGVGTTVITATQIANGSFDQGFITASLRINTTEAVLTNFGNKTNSNISFMNASGQKAAQMGIAFGGKLVEVKSPINTSPTLELWVDSQFISSYNRLENKWYDLSGNINNGILKNNFNYSTTDANSFVFNGVNNYVDFLKANESSDNVTLETWINMAAFSSGTIQTLFSHSTSIPGALRLEFNNTTLRANLSNTSTFYSCTTALNTNEWYYVVMVYSKTENSIKFYVNGALTDTIPVVSGPTIVSETFEIGAFNGTQHFFNGKMGAFKLHTNVLSAANILANFNTDKRRYGIN